MRTQCNFGLVPVTLSYVVKPGKNLSTRFGTMLTAGREVPGICQGTTSSVKLIQLIFYRKLLHTISQHPRPFSFAPQEALGRLPGQVLSTAGAGEEQGREVQKESDTEAGERLAPVSAGQTVLEKEPGAARKSRGKEVPGLCVPHALARAACSGEFKGRSEAPGSRGGRRRNPQSRHKGRPF